PPRAPRALPSLPTRRSSDLDPFRVVLPADHPQADQDGIDLAELAEENWINTARADHTCAALLADIYACAGFTPHHVLETEDSYADRKSTRLNSSHVKISYAV